MTPFPRRPRPSAFVGILAATTAAVAEDYGKLLGEDPKTPSTRYTSAGERVVDRRAPLLRVALHAKALADLAFGPGRGPRPPAPPDEDALRAAAGGGVPLDLDAARTELVLALGGLLAAHADDEELDDAVRALADFAWARARALRRSA